MLHALQGVPGIVQIHNKYVSAGGISDMIADQQQLQIFLSSAEKRR